METTHTLPSVIETLKKKGYAIDFHFGFNGIFSYKWNLSLTPGEFDIEKVYRFSSPTNPADEAFVYAINGRNQYKGFLVDDYGTSAGPVSENMERKFRLKDHGKEQGSYFSRTTCGCC